jgi:hypothetical protein
MKFNENSDYFENIMNEIKEYSKRRVSFQTKDDKIKKQVKIQFKLNNNDFTYSHGTESFYG